MVKLARQDKDTCIHENDDFGVNHFHTYTPVNISWLYFTMFVLVFWDNQAIENTYQIFMFAQQAHQN